LQHLRTDGLTLRGVIHGAGVLRDSLLQNQSWEQFASVLQPKVQGAWHLHHLTQSFNQAPNQAPNQSLNQPSDLEFFVLFSSVASLLGSPGQGNYAAANAFMDTLAQYRRSQGLPALSINWGPWANGGMAIAAGDTLQQRLVRSGFDLIDPNQGLEWLSRLLFPSDLSKTDLSETDSNTIPIPTQIPAQIGAMRIRWDDIRKRLTPAQQAFLSPVLEQLQETEDQGQTIIEDREQAATATLQPQIATRPSPMNQVLAAVESDRPTLFTTYLQQQIGQVLQLQPEQLSVTRNLMEVGMDSLMVMEAINQLRQDFDIMLYPREFYEHPTLSTLADYLAQEFTRLHPTPNLELNVSSAETPHGQNVSIPPSFHPSTSPHSPASPPSPTSPLILPGLHSATSEVTLHQGDRLPPAIFILSSPRSGSTLLRVMLAGHSKLFAAPELHLLPFNRMAERQQQLGDSHLSEGLERSLMDLNQWDRDTSSAQVQDWLNQNAPISEVYAALQATLQKAAGSGDRLLVDKSPTYAMHRPTLDRAEALFRNAKYIHLVRHPYSVMESFVRMRMDKLLGIPTSHPYQLAEQIWRQSNQNILDFAATIDGDRYHLIQYEDLVRDPSATLSHLCQFLCIDLEPSLLNPYEGDRMTDGVHDTSLSLGDPNFLLHQRIDPSLAEAWKTIALPQPLAEKTEAIAHTLNYTLLGQADGRSPRVTKGGRQTTEAPLRSSQSGNQSVQNLKSSSAAAELTLTLNGLTHSICTWGDDSAPPIVCIHGILDQGLIWEPVAQVLAQQGYRVIAPDLRGHGRSSHVGPGGSYHLLDFLSDIDAIINHLYPPTPHSPTQNPNSKISSGVEQSVEQGNAPESIYALIGHSMGSIIAALYASSRPERVRSLTLVETILPAEKRAQVTDQLTALLNTQSPIPDHPIFPDVATAARRLRQGTPSLSEDFSLKLAERICTELDTAHSETTTTDPNPKGVKWAWDEKLRNRTGIGFSRMPFGRGDYLQLLSQLSMPMTVLYGDRSTFNRPEDLAAQAEALSDSNRITLPGGHNLHLDAATEVARVIVDAIANAQ
ncbi:MAG: alpha/beta fold hydrolase, partial [Merismopedia sp. SIO2A8]|nr:alpha/beta fold hydrolase [Merismopedia sp. SIO2A8]